MDKNSLKHHDCRNFIPVDVAKGICSLLNKNVLIDSDICPKFTALSKCKNCANFKDPDEKFIGSCVGFKDNYWTFADLKAVTCEKYQVK